MINDTPLLLWYHIAQAGPPVGEEGLMLDYLINHRIPPTTVVQDTHCTALTWYYEGGHESFGVRFEFRDSSLQVCVLRFDYLAGNLVANQDLSPSMAGLTTLHTEDFYTLRPPE